MMVTVLRTLLIFWTKIADPQDRRWDGSHGYIACIQPYQ